MATASETKPITSTNNSNRPQAIQDILCGKDCRRVHKVPKS